MICLEDIHDIVISVGVDKNNNAVVARIATKKPIDLTDVFRQLRENGAQCWWESKRWRCTIQQ